MKFPSQPTQTIRQKVHVSIIKFSVTCIITIEIRGQSNMDDNIPPYYVDFPEYNKFSQSYLWPVTVKYKGQSEIHFSVSKSDTINAFHSIETVQKNLS